MYGPPDSWILREPPEACEHDNTRYDCSECEEERSYYEDMAADWAIERAKLGE